MRRIEAEAEQDSAAIERLLDAVFGVDRLRRTAWRFRDGVACVPGLSFVLREGGELVGSIRFWPIRMAVGGEARAALLLGPLAVDPARHGTGIGIALLRHGLAAAAKRKELPVFLIGDEPYYSRVGFRRVLPSRCGMPGPVEPERVLVWTSDPDEALPPAFALEPLSAGEVALTPAPRAPAGG